MSLSQLSGGQPPMQANPMTANPMTGQGPNIPTSFGPGPMDLSALQRPSAPSVTPGAGAPPPVQMPVAPAGGGPGSLLGGSAPANLATSNAQQAMLAAQQGRGYAPSAALPSSGGSGGGGNPMEQMLKNPDFMKLLASFGA